MNAIAIKFGCAYTGEDKQGLRGGVENNPLQSWSFGTVKEVLATVFGAGPDNLATLAAKINGLQRNGFVPGNPGRGKVIKYTVSDIYDLAVALSVAKFGLPPRIIALAVKRGTLNSVLEALRNKTLENDQMILIYFPSIFYEDLTPDRDDPMIFEAAWESQIGTHRFRIRDFPGGDLGLINLTALINRIDAAMATL